MDALVRLVDLPGMHPNLLWDTIIPATVAVFADIGVAAPHPLPITVQAVPGFGSQEFRLLIDPGGVSPELLAKVRRTYEPSRLVELAAIAVAALGLHRAGGHQIVDVARRGSGADYLLVDETHHHLEIAGRSRRRDLDAAWTAEAAAAGGSLRAWLLRLRGGVRESSRAAGVPDLMLRRESCRRHRQWSVTCSSR